MTRIRNAKVGGSTPLTGTRRQEAFGDSGYKHIGLPKSKIVAM